MNSEKPEEKITYAMFETEMEVRPDDIDLFRHVHSSRYIDYVQAGRSEQMGRCYGMSMEEFLKRDLGWYLISVHMNFKRALGYGERFVVRTGLIESGKNTMKVVFEIDRLPSRKRCFDGWGLYSLIDLKTGRAVREIPDDIRKLYEVRA